MFGSFLTFSITAMHLYVFWRADSVPFLKRHVPRLCIIGTGIALWTIFYLGRVVGHGGESAFAVSLEFLGMNWMAMLFLTFISLFAVDIVTGFGFLLPRFAPSMRGFGLLAGGVLSVTALFQGMRPPVVREYEVHLSGLPQALDGTVVVALSDLHLGSMIGARWLEARIDQVQAQKPDLVVLLGDLIEGHGGRQGDLLQAFRRLSAPLGVWAVTGNHESYGRSGAGASSLKDAGFTLLHNFRAEVAPGLVVAGIDDIRGNGRSGRGDPVGRALDGRPPGATLFLSHRPLNAERVAGEGVGLMLSGHTHGGQIWPFGYLVRHDYPMLGGRYEVGDMTVIVSRGAGTWGPRMRLWRPGEILRITLRRKDS